MSKALLFLALMFLALPAFALVEPGEALEDPALEARARAIAKDIRCPVCESQNIENSNADVARDLRLLIRERLLAGDTDEQVTSYLRERYGDAVLLDPPFTPANTLLWLGPFAALLLGGGAAFFAIRKGAA